MVQTYRKSTDISIIVWGAIWLDGRSDLVIMKRDEELKGGGYSRNVFGQVYSHRYIRHRYIRHLSLGGVLA